MKSSKFTAAIGALLLATAALGTANTAQAQTSRLHFGPRLSYHLDAEELGLGVQLGVPVGKHIEFYPSIDNYFVDRGSFVSFNADLKWRVAQEALNWLYLGGGLNVARRSINDNSSNDSGLNLFVGAESMRGRVHPFGELRMVSNNGTSAQIAVGLNFTLSNH